METANIQGQTRKACGRNANQRLRRAGLVPAIIYGHGETPEPVALSAHDLSIALEHAAHLIVFKCEGREEQYLIKDVQYDHLQSDPIHVDLMRVSRDERVEVKVPVVLRGTPRGIDDGGNLVHIITELDIECPVLNIPGEFRVHVEHLKLNESLHVNQIEVPADVTVLNKSEDIVAIVHPPRGTTAEEEEAAAAGEEEPEIIGKGKEEEGEKQE